MEVRTGGQTNLDHANCAVRYQRLRSASPALLSLDTFFLLDRIFHHWFWPLT